MSKSVPGPTQLRGDIEGLRAIAVLSVLLFHIGVSKLSGGFAGVDVFFVISGFLITSLLLKEVERTGRVSIGEFYSRRARRLLPAATVVLVATGLAGLVVLSADQFHDLGVDVAAAAGYVLNWVLASRSVDYLAEDAGASPLQHFWSLSVEEQFYVGWPLLLMLTAWVAQRVKWTFRTLAFVLLAAVFAASLWWSVRQTASTPATAYFVTTTRVWELGAGALLAILSPWVSTLGRWFARAASTVGIALIGLTLVVVSTGTAWPGKAALLPVVGTTAVIAAGCASLETPVARLLGVRPMRWVGGLSYSIYLWHWPLIVLASAHWPGLSTARLALVGLASIPLAWLTRHLVEDPVRFSKVVTAKVSRSLMIGAAGMAVSFLVAVIVLEQVPHLKAPTADQPGALALVADRQVSGVPPMIADPSSTYTVNDPLVPEPALAPIDIPDYYADNCQQDSFAVAPSPRCTYGDRNGTIDVAVVGDSKMGQWVPALEVIAAQEHWRLQLYLKSACTFTSFLTRSKGKDYSSCQEYGRATMAALTQPGAVPDIVFVSQGRSQSDGKSKVQAEYLAGMVEYWATLAEAGAKVVAIADNPLPRAKDVPGGLPVYACVQRQQADYRACSYTSNAGSGTPAMQAAVQQVPGSVLLNLNDWICPPGGMCPPAIGGRLILRQGSHLTASYVKSLAPLMARELQSVGVVKSEMPLEPVG